MGDSHQRNNREVRLDYAFDRLLATKLQQAYEILVPDQVDAGGQARGLNALHPAGAWRSGSHSMLGL
jgi:hypothetical protein